MVSENNFYKDMKFHGNSIILSGVWNIFRFHTSILNKTVIILKEILKWLITSVPGRILQDDASSHKSFFKTLARSDKIYFYLQAIER